MPSTWSGLCKGLFELATHDAGFGVEGGGDVVGPRARARVGGLGGARGKGEGEGFVAGLGKGVLLRRWVLYYRSVL